MTTLGLGFQPSVQWTVFRISHLQGSDSDSERQLRYIRQAQLPL